MTVIHARAFICFRFRFFFLILQLCEGYLSRRIFLQTSFNDTATLFIVNIYQTRQASALRTEYLILDSIFIIKKNISNGESIFKTQVKTEANKTEEPTDAFFDYRVRVVMTS